MSLEELSKILAVKLPEELIEKVERVEGLLHFNLYVKVDNAYELMKILHEEAGIYHLSTITGMEIKDKEFRVIYHLQHRDEETEKEVPINFFITDIKLDKPKTPSMIDFFVAADYYEREIYDFFGIYFENHPFMERLILPEQWPDDVRPMRKEYSWQDIKEITLNLAKKISED
ncbi:MAG: NADH-quinone oxidoreductase subunit C [Candidatus Heimdallarchaeaceae archaeon]